MIYQYECKDCGNNFEKGFFSLAKCPKCGSKTVLTIRPSRGTGCAVSFLGILMVFFVFLDLFTGFWPMSSEPDLLKHYFQQIKGGSLQIA
jgi:DNA-directed RNA polymerase subunit RPC12/RpoP